MKKYVIVSAVGRDRPGFVNRITHAVHELGGNIEIQRSTRMASEFAMLVLLSIEADGTEDAIRVITGLREGDVFVGAREALSAPEERPRGAETAEITASGADQPGIIDAVTLLLFQHNVNIESMDYDIDSAPFTGEHLFRMKATVAIPDGVDQAALRDKLQDMEAEWNFDMAFRCQAE